MHLALENNKRRAASFSVELRDEIDGRPFKRRCFFLRVGPGERRSIAYRCEVPVRGLAMFDGVIVATRFPFGLFAKTRFIELSDEVVVFPGKVRVKAPPSAFSTGDGSDSRGLAGSGNDFLELREMVPGDDARRVDWRATARTGRPFVRETERESRRVVEICLDASAKEGDPSAQEAAEERIRVAGSLTREYAAQGLQVRLVTCGDRVTRASGRQGLTRLLTVLALLDTAAEAAMVPPSPSLPGAVVLAPRGGRKAEPTRRAS